MARLPDPQPAPHTGIHWKAGASEELTFPEGAWSGSIATVEGFITERNKYQVKFEGTYWTATCPPPGDFLRLGEQVAVLGREGNELIVQKLSPLDPPHS
ncbi:MAG: NfeD family protein [Nodosilinea sp.]